MTLLGHGTNVDAPKSGWIPLQIAFRERNTDIVSKEYSASRDLQRELPGCRGDESR